jgi:DNA adenine methylase
VSQPKPFLKWAGGKRQLLSQIRPYYPADFARYWEPFVGSGAVFFDLWNRRLLADKPVFLIDNNPDLVGCYDAIRTDVEAVISELSALEKRHARNHHRTFYAVRRHFNAARAKGLDAPRPAHAPELAAMLIYLNRTGFNGLFRLNSRGSFNVPLGNYVKPRICDRENLRAVSAILRSGPVQVRHGSYALVLDSARRGDFVYFDPPYAPLSATSNFRSYTAEGFSAADQACLQRVVVELARRGCAVLLSNSSAPEIELLYEQHLDARGAGLRVKRIRARRAINSKGTARGAIDEFLVTNL